MNIKKMFLALFLSMLCWVIGGSLTLFISSLGFSILAVITCLITIFAATFCLTLF